MLGPLLYTMYTASLWDIMHYHEVSFHQYADDTQMYCALKTSDADDLDETKLKLEACISGVKAWMLHNNLQLNDNKMKILVFHAKHQPAPPMDCLQVVSTHLKPTDHARNIGVILDSNRSSKCVNLLFTQLDQLRELESFSVWKVPRLWCMLL